MFRNEIKILDWPDAGLSASWLWTAMTKLLTGPGPPQSSPLHHLSSCSLLSPDHLSPGRTIPSPRPGHISLVISKLPPAPQTCLSESQTALCALFTVYVGAALQARPNSQLGQSGDIVRDNKHWSAASGDMRQSATRCHMSGHGDNTGLYTWIY